MNNSGITVVDAQVSFRNVALAVLRKLGADTEGAGSGLQALELIENRPEPPALVLFDLSVTDIAPEAFAERIAALEPPPVLIFSGENKVALLHVFHAVPAVRHYIRKPFQPLHLYILAKGALEGIALPSQSQPLSFSDHTRKLVSIRNREAALGQDADPADYENLGDEYEDLNMHKEAHRARLNAHALDSGHPYGVQPSLSGVILAHRLESIFQFIYVQKLTGLLLVEDDATHPFRIYFSMGQILDAFSLDIQGYECLKQCVLLTHGRFSFYEVPILGERRIEQSTDALLLDLAIDRDHAQLTPFSPHLKPLEAHG